MPVASLDGVRPEQRIEDGGLGRVDDRAEERVEVFVVDELDRPQGSGVAARDPRPGREGQEDVAGAVAGDRAGPGQAEARPACQPLEGRTEQRGVGRDDHDAAAALTTAANPGVRPAIGDERLADRTPSTVSRSIRPKLVRASTPTV